MQVLSTGGDGLNIHKDSQHYYKVSFSSYLSAAINGGIGYRCLNVNAMFVIRKFAQSFIGRLRDNFRI